MRGFRLLCVPWKQEISPHGIQRILGSEKSNALTVAGKTKTLFARPGFIPDPDVHQPNRLFRSAAAGTRYARDPDAQRCSRELANAVGQRECHFRTDGPPR